MLGTSCRTCLVGEVLGAVDNATHTHGFVVANLGTVDQLFSPPSAATVHEFYHLVGCPHSLTLTKCYHDISELKNHTDPAKGFVPGIDAKGQFLVTRAEVNARLRLAMALDQVSRQDMTIEQQYDLEWTTDCQSKGTVTATPPLQRTSLARYRVVVCACVDESGTLTQDPVIVTPSGVVKADAAALSLAKAASGLYKPAGSLDKPAGNCQRTAITFKHTPVQ